MSVYLNVLKTIHVDSQRTFNHIKLILDVGR